LLFFWCLVFFGFGGFVFLFEMLLGLVLACCLSFLGFVDFCYFLVLVCVGLGCVLDSVIGFGSFLFRCGFFGVCVLVLLFGALGVGLVCVLGCFVLCGWVRLSFFGGCFLVIVGFGVRCCVVWWGSCWCIV